MATDAQSSQAEMPTFLDSHVHFWDPRSTPRPVSALARAVRFNPNSAEWIADHFFPRAGVKFFRSAKHLVRPYLPEHLEDDARDCNLDGVVHVEAGWLGRKVKRGFYDYRGENPVPTR